jgi:hypothetical protein
MGSIYFINACGRFCFSKSKTKCHRQAAGGELTSVKGRLPVVPEFQ